MGVHDLWHLGVITVDAFVQTSTGKTMRIPKADRCYGCATLMPPLPGPSDKSTSLRVCVDNDGNILGRMCGQCR